jgi:hypothetical protein
MSVHTIGEINRLSLHEKREIYVRIIPQVILDLFRLNPYFVDKDGHDLITLHCEPGTTAVELELRHAHNFPDPILYGHMTDTMNGQIHVLLYIINDPRTPRFDVDRLPDGTPTKFGTVHRNLDAERSAMQAGLAPGQIRTGLRILSEAIQSFDQFIRNLEHDMYFIEPLYYHNAVIFERHGFYYEKGRRQMLRIHAGFEEGGDLSACLDGSTPFRSSVAANSIRLRSWAVHDGILGAPLTDITMYKLLGKRSSVATTPNVPW